MPGQESFSISLVVATRDRLAHLVRRLPLWVRAGFDEVVIVDGSYDVGLRRETEKLCRASGAKYVPGPRTLRDTRARQRNIGAATAKSDWILFQDDDDTVPQEVRKDVLSKASQGVDWMIGNHGEHIILHRRLSFLNFGGYPEDMVAAEDIIMSNRCREHGRGGLVGAWHQRQVSPEQPREDPISRARNSFWYGVTVVVFLFRTPFRAQAVRGDLWRVGGFARGALHADPRSLVYLIAGLIGRGVSPLHSAYLAMRNGRATLTQERYHSWQGLRSETASENTTSAGTGRFGWRHFAEKAPDWWDPPTPGEFQKSQLDSIRKMLADTLPKRVLEIGVGRGRATSWLRDSWDYVGIEVNRSLLQIARHGGVNRVVLASGTWLPFRRSSFDAVVAYDVLMHIWDRDRFLNECKRVLGSSGVLIVNYLRRFSPGWRKYVLACLVHPRRMLASRDRRFDGTRVVKGSIARLGFRTTVLMSDTSSPILLARRIADAQDPQL